MAGLFSRSLLLLWIKEPETPLWYYSVMNTCIDRAWLNFVLFATCKHSSKTDLHFVFVSPNKDTSSREKQQCIPPSFHEMQWWCEFDCKLCTEHRPQNVKLLVENHSVKVLCCLLSSWPVKHSPGVSLFTTCYMAPEAHSHIHTHTHTHAHTQTHYVSDMVQSATSPGSLVSDSLGDNLLDCLVPWNSASRFKA